MATIQDDPESEDVESSLGDTTANESQRPQRSARTKNAACYKEPSLLAKIRSPSPLKGIKTERISNDGKENHVPNENVEDTFASDESKKIRDADTLVVIESPTEPATVYNCDHVLLRIDESTYEGPFKVVKRLRKKVIIHKNGKDVAVFWKRVKPQNL